MNATTNLNQFSFPEWMAFLTEVQADRIYLMTESSHSMEEATDFVKKVGVLRDFIISQNETTTPATDRS